MAADALGRVVTVTPSGLQLRIGLTSGSASSYATLFDAQELHEFIGETRMQVGLSAGQEFTPVGCQQFVIVDPVPINALQVRISGGSIPTMMTLTEWNVLKRNINALIEGYRGSWFFGWPTYPFPPIGGGNQLYQQMGVVPVNGIGATDGPLRVYMQPHGQIASQDDKVKLNTMIGQLQTFLAQNPNGP